VSKNPKGAVKAYKRSTIGLQILMELPTTTDINTTDAETARAAKIKINRTTRISKGDK